MKTIKTIKSASIPSKQPYNKELLCDEWPVGYMEGPSLYGYGASSRICKDAEEAISFLEAVKAFRDDKPYEYNLEGPRPIEVVTFREIGWEAYVRTIGEMTTPEECDSYDCYLRGDAHWFHPVIAVAWVPQQLN